MKVGANRAVVEDVDLSKRKYLYPNGTASSHGTKVAIIIASTTPATKAKANIILYNPEKPLCQPYLSPRLYILAFSPTSHGWMAKTLMPTLPITQTICHGLFSN